MNESALTSIILPASLFIIMLGMGFSLVVDDFRRVVRYPKAALIGLTNQLILLPIIGFLLAKGFHLAPEMAVGLMILAACPGGVTSNLITHVAKGDIALSITLTAIASFITVVSIPFIVGFSLDYFMGEGSTIELPVLKTIGQVVGITILPVSIGMIVRANRPAFANRMEKPMRIASTIIFIVVLLGIILANKDIILPSLQQLGLVALSLNIATMLLGYVAARIFNLNLKQSLSVTIESGIQNGTLAIVIATSILMRADMALPASVYGILMFFTGGFIMYWFGKRWVVGSGQ